MFLCEVFAFCIFLLINLANGAVDCTQKPSEIGKDCCSLPLPNFGAFEAKCKDFKPHSGNPCYLECLFNATLEGDHLNIKNAREMISKLFNGEEEFVEAYAKGFQQCEPVIKRILALYKLQTGEKLPKSGNCHLHAMFYGICAHEMLWANCPTSAWKLKRSCEAAKEIATKCEPLSFLNKKS